MLTTKNKIPTNIIIVMKFTLKIEVNDDFQVFFLFLNLLNNQQFILFLNM